jgi:hypothetical protein
MFHVFQASQVKSQDKGFLSRDITVTDMILYRGDIHHVFPKNYLKKHSKSKGEYNQIANFVLMQQEINIAIGEKSPDKYFKEIMDQCEGGRLKYGGITKKKELMENLKSHCIPLSVFTMGVTDYDSFLLERRELMAEKIRDYYYSL